MITRVRSKPFFRRRKLLSPALLLFLGNLLGRIPGGEDLPPLPPFQAQRLDGTPFPSSELRGKAVLLDFWAVWCRPCLEAVPSLNRLHQELQGEGFQVLGMASFSGGPEEVEAAVRRHGFQYPVVIAGEELLEKLKVIGFPTYFLITPEGRIFRTYVGEVENLFETISRDFRRIPKSP